MKPLDELFFDEGYHDALEAGWAAAGEESLPGSSLNLHVNELKGGVEISGVWLHPDCEGNAFSVGYNISYDRPAILWAHHFQVEAQGHGLYWRMMRATLEWARSTRRLEKIVIPKSGDGWAVYIATGWEPAGILARSTGPDPAFDNPGHPNHLSWHSLELDLTKPNRLDEYIAYKEGGDRPAWYEGVANVAPR